MMGAVCPAASEEAATIGIVFRHGWVILIRVQVLLMPGVGGCRVEKYVQVKQ